MEKKKLTTASGRPIYDFENTQSVGPRGPLLLQDYLLHEDMAHFNRERIPERVVHAKGSGAFGTFVVTHDISKYTKAKVFNEIGKQTRIFLRFSTVGGEQGSADTERDPRGFALKFYTEDGNWDLVGNNTPVFFIKDPKKFSHFIHTQKRHPRTHCKSPTMMWDFWSLNPESLHQVLILMSDRGTPFSYRHMNGYGSHTFSLINKDNERVWVKFHFKTQQGIKNFVNDDAVTVKGTDADHAQRDLVNAIDNKEFPRWNMKIQVMTDEQAKAFRWNPFDLTKVWPHSDFPLIDVGYIELNEVPKNYFRDVEQSAFAPAHVVDGIGYSPDKMLQGRILSYPDAHRYRLGVNYEQIPVNQCPYMTTNYQRDGHMQMQVPKGRVAYDPSSLEADTPRETPAGFRSHATADDGRKGRTRAESFSDHFSQARMFFRSLEKPEQAHLASALVFELSKVETPHVREAIVGHLRHIDAVLAKRVADGLGLDALPPAPPTPVKPQDMPPSPALQIIGKMKPTLQGRCVGILVDDGSDAAAITALGHAHPIPWPKADSARRFHVSRALALAWPPGSRHRRRGRTDENRAAAGWRHWPGLVSVQATCFKD